MNIHEGLPRISPQGFDGRDEALIAVKRYVHDKWPVMFYRADLLTHSLSVRWLVEELSPLIVKAFGSDFDPRKAAVLAEVHDDPELVTGDVPFVDKRQMNEEQMAAYLAEERRAVDTLVERWPRDFRGFNYRGLLLECMGLSSIEAAVVKYVDKACVIGESFHEVLANNGIFSRVSMDVVKRTLPELRQGKLSMLEPLLEQRHPFIMPSFGGETFEIFELELPKSIAWAYDFWYTTLVRRGGERAMRYLTQRVECI